VLLRLGLWPLGRKSTHSQASEVAMLVRDLLLLRAFRSRRGRSQEIGGPWPSTARIGDRLFCIIRTCAGYRDIVTCDDRTTVAATVRTPGFTVVADSCSQGHLA
jgi:hypothetical protein